jgi:hypothetical protein
MFVILLRNLGKMFQSCSILFHVLPTGVTEHLESDKSLTLDLKSIYFIKLLIKPKFLQIIVWKLDFKNITFHWNSMENEGCEFVNKYLSREGTGFDSDRVCHDLDVLVQRVGPVVVLAAQRPALHLLEAEGENTIGQTSGNQLIGHEQGRCSE